MTADPGGPTFGGAGEEQIGDLVQACADAIIVVDGEGTIRFGNPAAADLFGCPVDELAGRTFGRPVASTGPARTEIVRPNGDYCIAELRARPVCWNGAHAHVVTLRDLSEVISDEVARLRVHVQGLSHRLAQFEARMSDLESAIR